MAVVIASDLGKDIAGEPLLRGISFKLERRDRMTLSGRNGAGKTTLLRMLSGEASVDSGELVLSKGAKVSLHDQRPPRDRDLSLRDYILSGAPSWWRSRASWARWRRRWPRAPMTRRPSAATPRPRRRSSTPAATPGATAPWPRCTGSASATTPTLTARWTPSPVVSSPAPRSVVPWRGRPIYCSWMSQPIIWTSSRWSGWRPTSSPWTPRSCSSRTTAGSWSPWAPRCWSWRPAAGKFFSGTWHEWRKEKASRELALGRAIERQQAEIERLERFVTRFRAGTRARQAQSRVKKLSKIERLSADQADGAALAVRVQAPRAQRPRRLRARARRAVGGRQGAAARRRVVAGARRARVAGRRQRHRQDDPDRDAGGQAGAAARASSSPATTSSSATSPSTPRSSTPGTARTVLEATQRASGLTPAKARALLGRFLFSGEDAEKPLDGLSGGERRRLSLAILVHSGANVLILDEPTNHLDLESREALESALREFAGSLLLVSHDRALLDAIGTRTVALEDQELHSYVGGWPEYLRVREERAKAPPPPKAKDGSGKAKAAPGKAKATGPADRARPRSATRPSPSRGGAPRAWRPRSRPRRPPCASSRTSWPIRPPGRRPRSRRDPRRAMRRPSARWPSSTSAGRRSRAERRAPSGRPTTLKTNAPAPPGFGSADRADRRRQRDDHGIGPPLCRQPVGEPGDRLCRGPRAADGAQAPRADRQPRHHGAGLHRMGR